jgi:hypothetical protein
MSPQETLTSYATGHVLRAPAAALRERWEPRAPPRALLPAAVSLLPSRPATPAQGYVWGVEGVPGGLRAGKHRLQFAEADALGLGALDIAFDVPPADGMIRVRILPAGVTSASASASPDLAADPNPILVVPALDAMYEDGDNWPGAMATVFVFSRESACCVAHGMSAGVRPTGL